MKNYKNKLMAALKNYKIALANRSPKAIWISLIAAGLLIGGLGLILDHKNSPTTSLVTATPTAEIRITPTGFEPASLVIAEGTVVIWTNKDSNLHQISSNPHPSHTDLSELESQLLNQDQVYEYKFDKPGNFMYHDEQNPTFNAAIEVKSKD